MMIFDVITSRRRNLFTRRFRLTPEIITQSDQVPSKARFNELAAVIRQGLSTFIEVGKALIELRDGKAYQAAGYSTFADCCERAFKISRPHAYRLIDASSMAEKLSPIGDIPSEAVARELLKIKDESLRARAWKNAVALSEKDSWSEGVTARNIKDAWRRIERRQPEIEATPKPHKAEVMLSSQPPDDDIATALRTLGVSDPRFQRLAAADGLEIESATPMQLARLAYQAYTELASQPATGVTP